MAHVFISYRREDSAGSAGRIQDRLERELGREHVFIDVEDIPLGIDFVRAVKDEVARCAVLLAVIGPNWLEVCDEDGTRRLDNPTDLVRIEIATALEREISVIPILLDGTREPKADRLPKELKKLTLRNGLSVRHTSFHADLHNLIRTLKSQISAPRLRIYAVGHHDIGPFDMLFDHPLLVGRSPDCHICISNDKEVSARHCLVSPEDEGILVQDMQTGTQVHGGPDLILVVGRTKLRLQRGRRRRLAATPVQILPPGSIKFLPC